MATAGCVALDWPDQAQGSCFVITHEQQYQNHSYEWNQAGGDNDRIESVPGHMLARVGKMSDEFECNDRSQTCGSPAHTAYRGYGVASEKIGGQHIRDCGECGEGKRGNSKKQRDEIQTVCEDGWDKHRDADATEDNQRLSGSTERPSPLNQISGERSPKKFPISAAMKGIQIATRLLFNSRPFATK